MKTSLKLYAAAIAMLSVTSLPLSSAEITEQQDVLQELKQDIQLDFKQELHSQLEQLKQGAKQQLQQQVKHWLQQSVESIKQGLN